MLDQVAHVHKFYELYRLDKLSDRFCYDVMRVMQLKFEDVVDGDWNRPLGYVEGREDIDAVGRSGFNLRGGMKGLWYGLSKLLSDGDDQDILDNIAGLLRRVEETLVGLSIALSWPRKLDDVYAGDVNLICRGELNPTQKLSYELAVQNLILDTAARCFYDAFPDSSRPAHVIPWVYENLQKSVELLRQSDIKNCNRQMKEAIVAFYDMDCFYVRAARYRDFVDTTCLCVVPYDFICPLPFEYEVALKIDFMMADILKIVDKAVSIVDDASNFAVDTMVEAFELAGVLSAVSYGVEPFRSCVCHRCLPWPSVAIGLRRLYSLRWSEWTHL